MLNSPNRNLHPPSKPAHSSEKHDRPRCRARSAFFIAEAFSSVNARAVGELEGGDLFAAFEFDGLQAQKSLNGRIVGGVRSIEILRFAQDDPCGARAATRH